MTNKKILSILINDFRFNVFSIDRLESQNNEVFLVNKKYIAKTTARTEKHYKFLTKQLKNYRVKTPKILKIKKINSESNLIIYKLLEGHSLNDVKNINPKTWIEIGTRLKDLHSLKMGAINQKDLPHFSKKNWNLFFDNFIKYKNRHKKLVPSIISKNNLSKAYGYLFELKKLNNKDLAILHGDYVLKNILFSKQQKITGIIDFENAQLGNPLIELGFIYLWDGLMTNWHNIYKGYFSKKGLNKNKLTTIKKYSVICALILLSKTDLNKDQYKWVQKRFKNIIKELPL